MKTLRQILGDDLIQTVHDDRLKYPDGFFKWLQFNPEIWEMFEDYALRMAMYRKRFAARTIIEVIRWNNTIKQKGDPTFKISNNMIPGMARLWMAKYGHKYPKFFNIKG